MIGHLCECPKCKSPMLGKCSCESTGKKSKIPMIGKARDGAGPAYPYGRQSLPDYQAIYNVTPDKSMQRQMQKEVDTRRRANAHKNNGKFGFHGEPPKPVLRNDRGAYSPYEPGKAGKFRTKPTVVPPLIFKRNSGQERSRLDQEPRKFIPVI